MTSGHLPLPLAAGATRSSYFAFVNSEHRHLGTSPTVASASWQKCMGRNWTKDEHHLLTRWNDVWDSITGLRLSSISVAVSVWKRTRVHFEGQP